VQFARHCVGLQGIGIENDAIEGLDGERGSGLAASFDIELGISSLCTDARVYASSAA
jgi:hypothetical protein